MDKGMGRAGRKRVALVDDEVGRIRDRVRVEQGRQAKKEAARDRLAREVQDLEAELEGLSAKRAARDR
eukprot:CAMPEP_0206367608 /NCGR_PEP_ID=MMETSP0294-20121207/4160_1 /ASSEMBLY_ACC=CAM_ASM_000327 /TAXON_ID=39354 /ORGANISM="Heterosigma akashiwo, Strain CCMP2393" /LENGTH=67 /DNA_ID=CAMNT_0053813919 /DNA_START=523 /DNA_END=723 /DNA_ORIENTATION=+